jgi:hypothetical protein
MDIRSPASNSNAINIIFELRPKRWKAHMHAMTTIWYNQSALYISGARSSVNRVDKNTRKGLEMTSKSAFKECAQTSARSVTKLRILTSI